MLDILLNPWVISIGTAVISGVILNQLGKKSRDSTRITNSSSPKLISERDTKVNENIVFNNESLEKPLDKTTNDLLITPVVIRRKLSTTPPFQKNDVSRFYTGIAVCWSLIFKDVILKHDDKLMILTWYQESTESVNFDVLTEKYPQLKIMESGTKMKVSGVINEVTGLYINLKDVTLKFI